MKIGLVTDFYFPWAGGPAVLIRNLSRGLIERGHQVALLAPSTEGPASIEYEGDLRITRSRTIPSPFGFNLRLTPRPLSAVSQWLALEQPDIVHSHHPFPLGASAIIASHQRGITTAATNHTIPECSLWGIRDSRIGYAFANAAFTAWLLFLLRRCDGVATPTAWAAGALRRLGYEGEIMEISNGVDVERFSPAPPSHGLREKLGIDTRPIVLYTGRLDAEKQMEVWLKAAARVIEQSKNLPSSSGADAPQFVIGGRGAERQRLERMVGDLDLKADVTFIGHVDDSDLPDLYRLAALYFIASPVELQSISTLEAMACGLPIVAANAGALPELVHDKENGRLFNRDDSVAAAGAIDAILADRALAASMGRNSRAIATLHELERSVERYEEFLDTTAAKTRKRQGYGRGSVSWA